MLCPQCRRMVGKDGYCPLGHLARPELQVEKQRVATPPAAPPPPPPPRVPPEPAPPASDPYTPPGLGPSNPPPQPGASSAPATEGLTPAGDSFAPPGGVQPAGAFPPPPAVPSEQAPAIGSKRGNRMTAILVALGLAAIATLGFFMLSGSAGAANLKYAFTPGETHRYHLSMTGKFVGGNLNGAAKFEGTIDMTLRQVVRKVEEDGTAEMEFVLDRATISEGGRTLKVPIPTDVVTATVTVDGSVIDSEGGALAGLSKTNPAAGIVGPESFSPVLSDRLVNPGDSWKLDEKLPNPFGDAFHVTGSVRYVEDSVVGNEPAAVIATKISSPMNFEVRFAELSDMIDEDVPAELANAAMSFQGYLHMNITGSVAKKTGNLKSAVGDVSMTGTFSMVNIPGGNQTGVIDMSLQLTMTEI